VSPSFNYFNLSHKFSPNEHITNSCDAVQNVLSSSFNSDFLVNKFTHNVLSVYDELAPVRLNIINSKRKPWVTQDIKLLMKQRDKSYKLAILTGHTHHINNY
jgi:hypothetical protein